MGLISETLLSAISGFEWSIASLGCVCSVDSVVFVTVSVLAVVFSSVDSFCFTLIVSAETV